MCLYKGQVQAQSLEELQEYSIALLSTCSLKEGIPKQKHSDKDMIYLYYLSFSDIVHHTDGSQWGQVVTPGMVIHLKQSFTILNDFK